MSLEYILSTYSTIEPCYCAFRKAINEKDKKVLLFKESRPDKYARALNILWEFEASNMTKIRHNSIESVCNHSKKIDNKKPLTVSDVERMVEYGVEKDQDDDDFFLSCIKDDDLYKQYEREYQEEMEQFELDMMNEMEKEIERISQEEL